MCDDTIKVEVNYSLEDIQNFQRYHIYHGISFVWVAALAVMLVIGISLLVIMQIGTGEILAGATVLLSCIIALLITYHTAPKKAAKNLIKTNKFIQDTQHFQISEEQIKVNSSTGESNISWDMLYKAIEAKDIFLLYISVNQAFIIPKKCLTGPGEQVRLLREYIKNAPPAPKTKIKTILHRFGMKFLVYLAIFLIVIFFAFLYRGN